ncbi:MAG TPA: 50S ribosomal protein L29 [Acidobacteriaceae bacterium]|nr:50S ribosomal protein L29 [Acidobacteriaceae bacterium]
MFETAAYETQVGSWIWIRPERREAMDVEKIRNLSDDELGLEERKTGEQLFRLRFQMKLGQTEGVKKLRELRKDIARIKTIERERELGVHGATHKLETTAAEAPARHARKKAAKPARKKAAKKSASSRKGNKRTATRKSAARPTANKKKASRSSSVKKG